MTTKGYHGNSGMSRQLRNVTTTKECQDNSGMSWKLRNVMTTQECEDNLRAGDLCPNMAWFIVNIMYKTEFLFLIFFQPEVLVNINFDSSISRRSREGRKHWKKRPKKIIESKEESIKSIKTISIHSWKYSLPSVTDHVNTSNTSFFHSWQYSLHSVTALIMSTLSQWPCQYK